MVTLHPATLNSFFFPVEPLGLSIYSTVSTANDRFISYLDAFYSFFLFAVARTSGKAGLNSVF